MFRRELIRGARDYEMLSQRYRFLTDFFAKSLPFTPTPGQVDIFERDLALVSPYIMGARCVKPPPGALC